MTCRVKQSETKTFAWERESLRVSLFCFMRQESASSWGIFVREGEMDFRQMGRTGWLKQQGEEDLVRIDDSRNFCYNFVEVLNCFVDLRFHYFVQAGRTLSADATGPLPCP